MEWFLSCFSKYGQSWFIHRQYFSRHQTFNRHCRAPSCVWPQPWHRIWSFRGRPVWYMHTPNRSGMKRSKCWLYGQGHLIISKERAQKTKNIDSIPIPFHVKVGPVRLSIPILIWYFHSLYADGEELCLEHRPLIIQQHWLDPYQYYFEIRKKTDTDMDKTVSSKILSIQTLYNHSYCCGLLCWAFVNHSGWYVVLYENSCNFGPLVDRQR